MALVIEWLGNSVLLKDGESAVIGRSKSADISLDNKRISRQHLTISNDSGTWQARDIGSSNGTYLNGKIVSLVNLSTGMELNLGGADGISISFAVVSSSGKKQKSSNSQNNSEQTGFFSTKDITRDQLTSAIDRRVSLSPRFKIGRDSTCDLRLDDLMVSKHHAEIVLLSNGTYEIVDLGSSNGTWVDGNRVKRKNLSEGDDISIGKYRFVFAGSAIEPAVAVSGLSLFVKDLNYEIKGKRLLDSISLELKPSSVTAILGPSGSGKSTLLAAITGRMKGSSGKILLGGKNLIQHFDEIRNQIGFVPQSDLLHTNLTVMDALRYGAKLRFPKGTNREEIEKRIAEVLQELELTERADLRIDQLSGGQKKRASVAMELLTEPLLIFLDEPTSGLDPGLDRQVMALLRKLADRGKTVVVVTHSTSNLDLADDLALLAPGGRLAYFGSPKGVLQTFSAKDWSEVFNRLQIDGKHSETDFIGKRTFGWRNQTELDSFSTQSLQGWFKQFLVLAQRYFKVLLSDRPLVLFMSLLPLLMAAVGQLAGSEYGLSAGPATSGFLNPSARSILLVLILGNSFIGASTSIQELVKERVIYAREHSVGLRASTYITSKLFVLGAITTIQSAIFTTLVLAGRDLPSEGSWSDFPIPELILAGAALAITSMTIGLMISALIVTREVAMPVLVVLTLVQVVLSGAVPLSVSWILDTFAKVIPAYWSMNLMAGTSDLNSLSFNFSNDYVDAWNAKNWIVSIFLLLCMSIFYSLVSWVASLKIKIGRQ